MKEFGSEVARHAEGEVAQQAKGSQPTQIQIMIERRDPLFAQKIDTRFSRDCKNANSEK